MPGGAGANSSLALARAAVVSDSEQRNQFRTASLGMLIFPRDEAAMQNSDELRKFAQNCTELADTAHGEPNKKRFERMAEAWNDLAQSQAWLDGEKPGQGRAQENVQENVQESAQESPVKSV